MLDLPLLFVPFVGFVVVVFVCLFVSVSSLDFQRFLIAVGDLVRNFLWN